MNWFWKRWFIDGGVPDLSIKKVVKAGTNYTVTIDCVGQKPVPVDLTIAYTDGTKSTLHRSIAVWKKANTVILTLPAKTSVKSISLGSTYVPDVNRKNNVWNNK